MLRLALITDELASDLESALTLARRTVTMVALRRVDVAEVLELDDAAAVVAALARHGLGCASLLTRIGKPGREDHRAEQSPRQALDQLLQAQRLAHDLQATCVRVFASSAVVTALSKMEDPAVLAVETEGRTQSTDLPSAVALARATGTRIVLDPVNVWRGGTWRPGLLEDLDLDLVADVHVKDVDAGGAFVPPGTGVIGWPTVVRSLSARGYDGMMTVESRLSPGVAAGAAGFVKQHWDSRSRNLDRGGGREERED